jgi:hypothetical protein
MSDWWVIEGPDDTGKTTLARGLERRGWTYVKATADDRLPVLAVRMAGLLNQNVVWDRAHLSEMVHHPERVDSDWKLLIETMLHSIDARCVLLTQRVGREGEEFENDDAVHRRLVDTFLTAAAFSGLRWQMNWPDPMPRHPHETDDSGALAW